MTEDEFAALVGEELLHVTPAGNLAAIGALGLLRPLSLARRAGLDPEVLVLRDRTVTLDLPEGVARLNHQLPLRAGRRQAFLDGATLEDWSRQLDGRVFLWPARARMAFAGSVAAREPVATLRLDARGLFRAMAAAIDLAPINTGSALRRPARRGAWIYVPATAPMAELRERRRLRGLVRSPDGVAEVSLRADIPAPLLARLRRT